jgi:hypothetical protein
MKIKNVIYSAFLIILASQGYGQKANVVAADKKYAQYAYIDAIATYESVAEKG